MSSIYLLRKVTNSFKFYFSDSKLFFLSSFSSLNKFLFVESNYLLRSICYLPSYCILFMIFVFSLLASNNLFFVDIKDYIAFSTFLIDSLSSCLNFYLISKTYLVGSNASKILRSIKSPNLSICFSLYLLVKS